ncbi:MAG: hypothetical protein PHT12_03055 [Patescibacteria group bacterium]|nr:hypothetical protein [Patescibacteria group bacterium]
MSKKIAKSPDIRSGRFAFVPFCLFAQAFQAKGLVRDYPAQITPVVEALMASGVNIIQMPCPESRLAGLAREPHGYKWYDQDAFRSVCEQAAGETVEMMKTILVKGYSVAVVIGVELSPSCSVLRQFDRRRGQYEQSGWFIQALRHQMRAADIKAEFIGINRRFPNKTAEKIRAFLS